VILVIGPNRFVAEGWARENSFVPGPACLCVGWENYFPGDGRWWGHLPTDIYLLQDNTIALSRNEVQVWDLVNRMQLKGAGVHHIILR
jgi:hypothetical protein